jgi:uncharacterized protein (DUF1697 family)
MIMKIYISLLRGINVGGHRKIKMADLREVYLDAGMTNVSTYIQSGNVVFIYDDEVSTLQQALQDAIAAKFGFEVNVLLRTGAAWSAVATSHPFADVPDFEEKKLYVTALATAPIDPTPIPADTIGDERYQLSGDVVYLYCTNGRGKTKLANDMLERHYSQRATTRNWKTTQKLAELAAALA